MRLYTDSIRKACIVIHPDGIEGCDNLSESEYYRYLFDSLRRCGEKITLLIDTDSLQYGRYSDCIERYGFKVQPLNVQGYASETKGVWGIGKKSHLVYELTKNENYTHIFCVDSGALLFYSCIAKSLGVTYKNTILVTLAVLPTLKKIFSEDGRRMSPAMLGLAYMERHSIENSDLILTSSSIKNWMVEGGYSLRGNVSSIFDIDLPLTRNKNIEVNKQHQYDSIKIVISRVPLSIVTMLVKGLIRFWDDLPNKPRIVFFREDGVPYSGGAELKKILFDARFEYEHQTFSSTKELYDDPGDNSIIVLYDIDFSHNGIARNLMRHNMSFVFCSSGDSIKACYANQFEGYPQSFVDILKYSQAGTGSDRNVDCLEGAIGIQSTQFIENRNERSPFVTVCVVHHQRPEFLARVLESLDAQIYKNFEVVVVDDGSPSFDVIEKYELLAQKYSDRDWVFLKQENKWLGTARNYAASFSKGEYLIFMDDDNIATTYFVKSFVDAIVYSEKDILTCFAGIFEENGCQSYQDNTPKITGRFLPIGGAAAAGYFFNIFGDAACIVKKHVFDAIGGFWQHYGLPKEDHEFFTRAVEMGYELEVLPEILFFYRRSSDGMMASSNGGQNFARSVDLILSKADVTHPMLSPIEFRGLLMLSVHTWYGKGKPFGILHKYRSLLPVRISLKVARRVRNMLLKMLK